MVWCRRSSSSWDLHEDGRRLLPEPPPHARRPFHPLCCGPETEQEEGASINTFEASAYLADRATRELLLGSMCFLRPALPSFECAAQRHGPPRRTCTAALGLGIGSGREVQLESPNTRGTLAALAYYTLNKPPKGARRPRLGGEMKGNAKPPGEGERGVKMERGRWPPLWGPLPACSST